MKSETIALLIRESEQIGECLPSIDFLWRSTSKIQIVLLKAVHRCGARHAVCQLESFQKAGVECYAQAPCDLQSRGFQVLDADKIASLLTHADVVIAL